MSFAVGLLIAGVLTPLLAARLGRWALGVVVAILAIGLLHDIRPVVDPSRLADAIARLDVLDIAGGDGVRVALLVAAVVWCGPAADQVVRRVLSATGLPAPEAAAEAGLRAGRWIGRLERWLLVACVAAGQPALAVIPVGGKALFRYAEVVADARGNLPRLERAAVDSGPTVTRHALVDYVIVGSLASWVQAIVLGLLVLAR